jgi:primosomal protein N' (replication factor Y)
MREHIDAGQQVLLFLNRRGYAPTLYCHQCSWAMECSNCSAHLVYHQKDGRMWCHHCGLQAERPKSCDNCHSEELIELGFGTQRIEQDITQHFSDTPILRIDRDSVRKKGELERLLAEIQQGKPAILVGTQMLAKGHHFPNVSLVGVLSIDHGFYSSDFRALERMGQLIVQVAGRAGRGEVPGKMLLQTHQPHNTDLQTLLKTGYATFADKLLAERESALLPPYSFHALIQLEAKTAEMAETVMIKFLHAWQRVNANLDAAFLGPIPAPMPRRAGMQRYEALIQTGNRGVLRQALAQWLEEVQKINLPSQLFWALDVDPTGHY